MGKFIAISFLLLLPMMLFAGDIKGTVTDTNTGEALVGANVSIQGESMGAATDNDGYFIIKNVPTGEITMVFNYVGYKELSKTVTVTESDLTLEIELNADVLFSETITVEISRAKERETPIAFSELGKSAIKDLYTTQDIPGLLKAIPGVFTTSAGLGESEIYIRGMDGEHVQVLVNGIPENDPESQVVYWSNWTGLSGTASSIQVQRGVGASLVGSGSFGGSVNISTSEYSPTRKLEVTGSSVNYFNGNDKVADGTGGRQNVNNANQLFSISYGTGLLYDGLLNVFARYERKAGDSYMPGTYYNGHSFYIGAQSFIGDHVVTINLHGAPQRHNQARATSDLELMKTLGREYNRNNHPYQENYYFKPQYELHDDWKISEDQFLTTRLFATTGTGGGRYLRNDVFDVETGAIGFKDVSESTDAKYFGRHARYIYEKTGISLSGYNSADTTYAYNGNTGYVSTGRMLISSSFAHSWRNDSQNLHSQIGANTAYKHKINDMFTITIGGEIRHWKARHTAQSFDFRKIDLATGDLKILGEVQRRYDYDGIVDNLSGFGRVMITPMDDFTVMIDGQFASYSYKIEERPFQIYDFATEKFIGKTYLATENDGTFSASDYKRTYDFFMPKVGANYNINENLNVFANYSISKKEPKVGDWYSRTSGPRDTKLDPETLTNIEVGVGYSNTMLGISANFYVMDFEDKIESITNQAGDSETVNAGNARHTGFELTANTVIDNIDGTISVSYAVNEWQSMSVQKIFGVDASEVKGKVVPFSPGTMLNGEAGYTINNVRFSLGFGYWDEFYVDYTNDTKLDAFKELNASINYKFKVGTSNINLRLNLNNITNEENISSAAFSTDFGRNDALNGKATFYVLPAPKFNTALTASISL